MTVGKYAALKAHKERVGKVLSIDNYDICEIEMVDTKETAFYPINYLVEVEEDINEGK